MKEYSEDESEKWIKYIYELPDSQYVKVSARDLKALLEKCGINKPN